MSYRNVNIHTSKHNKVFHSFLYFVKIVHNSDSGSKFNKAMKANILICITFLKKAK